jgi:hypothetical protein
VRRGGPIRCSRSGLLQLVAAVILLLAIWLVARYLPGHRQLVSPPTVPTGHLLRHYGAYMGAAVSAVDEAVSMLTTLQIALFVVVGYVLRGEVFAQDGPRRVPLAAGILFLATAVASLTLGYAARVQMIDILDQASLGLGGIETTIARQALLLAISAVAVLPVIHGALSEPTESAATALPPPTAPPQPGAGSDGTGGPDAVGRARLMIGIGVALLLAAPAHAAPCRQGGLSRRIAALPDVIAIAKGEQPRQALSRALGCELPPPVQPTLADGQPVRLEQLAGKRVFGAGNEELGTVRGFTIEPGHWSLSAILASTTGPDHVAVALDHFLFDHGKLSLGETTHAEVAALRPVNPGGAGAFDTSIPPAGSSFGGWSVGWLGQLGPKSVYVRIRITSTPTGAQLLVGNNPTGIVTDATKLVRQTKIPALQLVLKGYRPCPFVDGVYDTATLQYTGYAIFRCALTASPAAARPSKP